MRDYDPEKDDWVHRVTPRAQARRDQSPAQRDLCRDLLPHEFERGECVVCGAEDDTEDRPMIVHAYDTRDDHLCFAGCRHARTPEGRYTRPLPDFDNLYPEDQ